MAGVEPGVVVVGGDGEEGVTRGGELAGAGVDGAGGDVDGVGVDGTGGDVDVDGGGEVGAPGTGGGVVLVGGGAVVLVDGGDVGAGDAPGGEADIILIPDIYKYKISVCIC